MNDNQNIIKDLETRFGPGTFVIQPTADEVLTVWFPAGKMHEVLEYLKKQVSQPYRMLYDLTAIDERTRVHREGQPDSDFTVVYHLLSPDRNSDIRLKAALKGEKPSIRTISDIWPNANWYEREAWDLFGIVFEGHPDLRRILLPPWWKGHPLRKDHYARATEVEPFKLTPEMQEAFQESLAFKPEDWGMKRQREDSDFMFLNLGPHHPGTHGPFRIALQLDGEEIVDCVPDIGFHHRGAEKMGERQSWHTYIPYTDRVDYLGGVMNNMPYCMALEKLAGIEVPDRAKVIRIMMCELFRISSHLVWYGTFAGDLGAMSPVFFMFVDRERVLSIVEAVTGGRMHPSWFRIGGVAQDLPAGWEQLVRDFLNYMPARLDEYDTLVMGNRIVKDRCIGVGMYNTDEAIDWGVTGPGLRATGLAWDWRKKRPYGGYDQFDFEVPTAGNGDVYDRALVHVLEMRQSLRIIDQCLKNMPAGDYKSRHPLATPPMKERTMQDIETLIDHFVNVSWGPVMPVGETSMAIEATKGSNAYYLISDGCTMSYRTRIRTPSFAHIQMLPHISRGMMVADLLSILGGLDYVLADVDR